VAATIARRWTVKLLVGVVIWCGLCTIARAQVERAHIEGALERYRGEPTVDALVEAALAQPPFDVGRLEDARTRARLAGLLPQLRADVRRGQALDLGALTSSSSDRQTWSTGDELSFGGSASFPLDRLAFAPEETALLRERRRVEERRYELIPQMVRLYFERRRLQLERDLSGRVELASELRILELEALLDGLSGGAFSRMMAQVR
jgi:hypothetical protein